MNFKFDENLANNYKSNPQKIRVLTESWIEENLYCPRCGNTKIVHFPNNRKVADFYCPVCKSEYELKSKSGLIGNKITDGAYYTFIQRITSNNNPDFFILSYNNKENCVENLWIIPKHFFVPEIIEKRNPLTSTARRAGWVGCNIVLGDIPRQGIIKVIQNRNFVKKEVVINEVHRASLLYTSNLAARGWLMDILNCVNKIHNEDFTLEDMYQFIDMLKLRHPNNNNIKAKIRQQLQLLRDKNIIEFVKRGKYKKKVYVNKE